MSSKYYNIRTEPRFLNRTEPNSYRTEYDFFLKTEQKPNQNKNLFRTSLVSEMSFTARQNVLWSYHANSLTKLAKISS